MTQPLHVVHVASEMAPLAKVGGLADVVGALAREQARRGHRVTVALPAYESITLPAGWSRRAFAHAEVPWGMGHEPARFDLAEAPGGGLRVLLVNHDGERGFFEREGIYDDPRTGEGYPDNAERFLFFSRAALEGLKKLGDRVDLLHAHDQQAAWTPCFVRTHEAHEPVFAGAATMFTVHNLGYQGIVDPWVLGLAGFGGELFYPASPFEYWGRVNPMKVGLAFADLLTTVSPRYAREIQTAELGFGLEGVLARRKDDLFGVLNGIDTRVWDPATDPYLPARYDRDLLDGKAVNRASLIAECGFPEQPDWPLVGMVSRLVEQKGLDLIEAAEKDLRKLEARFVFLGSGAPRYQDMIRRLAHAHPDRFYLRGGYDEAFAHLVEAGSDLYLMPSRYEPCGLNQMYSLRYGTVPVVRAVGGLADSVEEFEPVAGTGTGFLFQRFEAGEMVAALRRALSIHRQPTLWRTVVRNGMSQDFSWSASANEYDRLYALAREKVAGQGAPTLEAVRAGLRIGQEA
jgi:starch synthase